MHDHVTSGPVLNHVAISVDADVLDDDGRADLIAFFDAVFGWTEGDNSTETGNPLIIYTGQLRQYLYFLPAAEEFLRAPRLDHIGVEVGSVGGLREIVERARAFKSGDDRVTVIEEEEMVTHGTETDFVLTHAYVGFLLPLLDRAPAPRGPGAPLNGPSPSRTPGLAGCKACPRQWHPVRRRPRRNGPPGRSRCC